MTGATLEKVRSVMPDVGVTNQKNIKNTGIIYRKEESVWIASINDTLGTSIVVLVVS
jgi:hypothetical protein